MAYPIPEHIDIPYSDDDEKVARAILFVFGFEPDLELDIFQGNVVPIRARDPADRNFEDNVKILVDLLMEIRCSWTPEDALPSGDLWRHAYGLGEFWYWNLDQEWLKGPLAEPEVACRPMAGSSADFIYMAMRAVGVKFDDAAFRHHFIEMRRELANDIGYDCDMEDDDPWEFGSLG